MRVLFNSAGQVLNQYAYRPFGEMESLNEQIANPLRFTAREYDTSTGLYYYRNRWYDPQLARFISEDPLGVAGGVNVYAYVGNDPVNYTDPMGLMMQQPCKRDFLGLALAYAGLCTWNMGTILLDHVYSDGFDAHERDRERAQEFDGWNNSGVTGSGGENKAGGGSCNRARAMVVGSALIDVATLIPVAKGVWIGGKALWLGIRGSTRVAPAAIRAAGRDLGTEALEHSVIRPAQRSEAQRLAGQAATTAGRGAAAGTAARFVGDDVAELGGGDTLGSWSELIPFVATNRLLGEAQAACSGN